MKRVGIPFILAVIVVTILLPAPAWLPFGTGEAGRSLDPTEGDLPAGKAREEWWERREGGYYTVRSEPDGQVITYTALELRPGDLYIRSDNARFRVTRVDGDEVWVKEDGEERLPVVEVQDVEEMQDVEAGRSSSPAEPEAQLGAQAERFRAPLVGIYFTHSDESYRPSSGTASLPPRGEVYRVGEALARGLRENGVRVDYREETHVPHDGLAYLRSRATVRKMLARMPAVLLDIHRDSVPADVYTTEIQGRKAARVRIVVGRQNPQAHANFDFAKRLKAVADRLFPGLVLDIFFGHGNYNQDVGPRSVLLEFGTADNPVDQAMVAAQLFSKVIPAAAGLTPGVATPVTAAGLRYLWAALGLVAVVGGGFLLFYWLNRLRRPG